MRRLCIIGHRSVVLLGTAIATSLVNDDSFPAGGAVGDTIQRLRDPFAGMELGTTTYATVGPVPGQLALSGTAIVRGSAEAMPGIAYAIGIVATSGDGKRSTMATITLMALGRAADGPVPPVVNPTPTPTPTPAPTPTPTPTVYFASATISASEGNSGTKDLVMTARRSTTSGAVSVTATFIQGTASAADFAGGALPGTKTFTFADGSDTATATVTIAGDTVVEADETFGYQLVAPIGYALGTTNSLTGTILNDDVAVTPTVFFAPATISATEGNSGTKDMVMTARRSTTSGAVNVTATFVQGSAGAADFAGNALPGNKTFAFAAGSDTATASVTISGDTDVEADDTFGYQLVAPSGYALGSPSSLTGTILNDDAAAFTMTATQVSSQPAQGVVWERPQATDARPLTFTKLSGDDTASFDIVGDAITLTRQAYTAGKTYKGNFQARDANGATALFSLSRTIENTTAPTLVSESYTPSLVGAAGTAITSLADGRWHRNVRDANPPASPNVFLAGDGTAAITGNGGWDAIAEIAFTAGSVVNPKVSLTIKPTAANQRISLLAFSNGAGERILVNLTTLPGNGSTDLNSNAFGPTSISVARVTGWYTVAASALVKEGDKNNDTTGRIQMYAYKPETFTFAFDTTAKTLTITTGATVTENKLRLVFDLSGFDMPTGKDFGFGTNQGYTFNPVAIYGLQYSTASGSLTTKTAPKRSGNNVITQTWSYAGFTPQDIDARLRVPGTNTVLQDWAPAKVSGIADGDMTVETTSPGVPSGYVMDIRNRRDTAVVGTGTQPVLTYSVVNVRFGVNPGPVSYFSGVPMRMNFMEQADPRIGYTNTTWDAGANRVYFPRAGVPAGDYKIRATPGATMAMDNNGGPVTASVISSDAATGTHVLRVISDLTPASIDNYMRGQPVRSVTFSQLVNFVEVVEKDGAPIGRMDFNPYFLEFHSQFTGLRTLDMGFANTSDPNKDPSRYGAIGEFKNFNSASGLRSANMADFIDAANALRKINNKFDTLWINIPNDMPASVLKAGLDYARDNLEPNIQLLIECNNEIWNMGVFYAYLYGLMIDAIMAGWYSTTSTYASRDADIPAERPKCIRANFAGSDQNSGVPEAVAMSKMIFHPCPAGVLFTALKDNPAGTPFTDTTAWDRSPTDKYMQSGVKPDLVFRAQMLRHKEVTDMLVSSFGDANVPTRASMVVMAQQQSNYAATIKPILDVPGVDARTAYIGTAPYNYPTGASDKVWDNASMVDALYTALDSTRSSIRGLENYALSIGKQTAYYEFNKHDRDSQSANYAITLADLAHADGVYNGGRTVRGYYKDHIIMCRQEMSGRAMLYNGIYNTLFGIRPTVDYPYRLIEQGIADGIAAAI